MRTLLLAALLTLFGLTGATAQGWSQDSGQARVTGSGGTDLTVACPAEGETRLAFARLQAPAPFAGQVGQLYPVTFTVDERAMTLVMRLSQAGTLEYQGSERVYFRALDALVRDLGAGRSLAIEAPHLEWREDFSLKGSGKALDGIFKGCEPAT